MCDASTLATASIGGQSAGAAVSTVGAYYGAKSSKIALNAQANIADINARISELSAQSELEAGQRKEQASRLTTAKVKSSQKAAMAANGIDLGSDTAVNIQTTTDVLGEVDANTIAANAARSAWGYRTQGVNFKNDALFKRASAGAINPWMAAGGTLLTNASSVATNWYLLKKAGVWGNAS